MANLATDITKVLVPEVLNPMLSAHLTAALKFTPFATVDTQLVGQPGDTVKVPQWKYFGPASDYVQNATGNPDTDPGIQTKSLSYTAVEFFIKQIANGCMIYDNAVNTGYGDPATESVRQLALSMADKIDFDVVAACYDAVIRPEVGATDYDAFVDANAAFDEEDQSPKVVFIHPEQRAIIQKNELFIDAQRYQPGLALTGEIGSIVGNRIVVSKKVKKANTWYYRKADGTGDTTVTGANLADVQATVPNAKVGDVVQSDATPAYLCPIIATNSAELLLGGKRNPANLWGRPLDESAEQAATLAAVEQSLGGAEAPALKYLLKKSASTETEREPKMLRTAIYANQVYSVGIGNEAKVGVAAFALS